jgi:NAD(P) transhydrogenase
MCVVGEPKPFEQGILSTPFDFDLICIGSGPAGQRASVQASKFGKRVALIERNGSLGGVCALTGTIPSKTFREAVLSFTGVTGSALAPVRASAAPPTAGQLFARVHEVVADESRVILDQLHRNGVTVVHGNARFEDPHTLSIQSESTTRQITAANILVAVGTKPAPLERQAADADILVNSDEILQIKQLPRTMTVVGGGVIGIEYASMFAALGIEVTLVEKRPKPLEFLDSEIVDELVHQMRKRNVTFRFGEAVQQVRVTSESSRHAVLTLESGKRLVSDLVLFTVGRSGATSDLNLPAAGLKTNDRQRLKVDDGFRTEVPHILAAGDVIGFPSLAATSSEQGRLAACEAFKIETQPMTPHYPVGIYAIPEISMVGAPEHELTQAKTPYETGVARYREIARGQILGDDSGLLKMLFHAETRQLLGIHIIGTGATELVHVGQAVLSLKGGLDYFLKTVFNYPTLAECYKVAALDAQNKLSQ